MDSIIFVPLEPISTSLRTQWIHTLSGALKKRNVENFEVQARKIEHYCNLTRQARIKLDEDVGAFKYGARVVVVVLVLVVLVVVVGGAFVGEELVSTV